MKYLVCTDAIKTLVRREKCKPRYVFDEGKGRHVCVAAKKKRKKGKAGRTERAKGQEESKCRRKRHDERRVCEKSRR